MRVPVCRVVALGDVSAWGRQFLVSLQTESIIDAVYEQNVARFCSTQPPSLTEPYVVFIENLPESRGWILNLRNSNKHIYIAWYGRNFSKDDLHFAIEQRIYCVMENLRPEEKRVMEWISKLGENRDGSVQFEAILRSAKAILLQADQEDIAKPLIAELKTAVTKIEKVSLQNEYHHPNMNRSTETETKLPLQKSQDFSDALTTISDLERTGALFVKGALPNEEGKVEFLQGKITSSVAGEVHGLKALFRMFLWDSPRFMFTRRDPKDCVLEEQLNLGVKYICEEGTRQKNRFSQIRKELPPLELRLELEPSQVHASISLSAEDFPALASVVEHKSVSQVLDYNELPDVHLYESLIRLRRSNMLRVIS